MRRWQAENPERVLETRRRLNATPERKRKGRDAYYQRTYAISADEFDVLLAKQGGLCAICAGPDPTHLDHDHAIGEIRGILCVNCNHGLGKFFDDVDLLEGAVAYLRGR